jgi:hypothetical protein
MEAEVVHCHVGLVHTHVQQIPQGLSPQKSLYAPSSIMRFVSLDIFISLVEYYVSFAKGKYNIKE